MQTPMTQPTMPWWRFPMVWLVIAGPAVVVVASFLTLALAIARPDPVIGTGAGDVSAQPAVQARNHAAAPRR
jgi:uncharacterized protein